MYSIYLFQLRLHIVKIIKYRQQNINMPESNSTFSSSVLSAAAAAFGGALIGGAVAVAVLRVVTHRLLSLSATVSRREPLLL